MTKKEISKTAEQVFKLLEEQKQLEKQLKELKAVLKAEGNGKYGDYLVVIEDRSRESFSLKEAKESVTEAVWNKIKKFVKQTDYQQVKVVKA